MELLIIIPPLAADNVIENSILIKYFRFAYPSTSIEFFILKVEIQFIRNYSKNTTYQQLFENFSSFIEFFECIYVNTELPVSIPIDLDLRSFETVKFETSLIASTSSNCSHSRMMSSANEAYKYRLQTNVDIAALKKACSHNATYDF